MAGPITWRNVQGDGGRMGAQLLRGGQDQIMGAGDSLLRTLDQYRKMNVANAGIIKQDNTQNFLDQVAAAGGADQLANPQVAAQLDQARLEYGANIDRNVARGAVAERLGQLQGQAVKTQQYNDVTEEAAQRPILEDLAQKLYSGDTKGYEQVLQDNHLRNEDKLRAQLASRQDDVTNQGYRAAGEKRAQGAEQRAIGSYNLSQEVGKENLANSRQERQYRDDQRELKLAGDAIKMVTDESAGELASVQTNNIFATGSTDVNKDAKTILTNAGIVDKAGDGEFDTWFGSNAKDRQKMQEGVTSLLSDGITLKQDGKETKIPIPPAMIEGYLQSVKGRSYITSSPEKQMTEYFSNMFKDNPELGVQAIEGAEAKKKHNSLISELKKASRELTLSKNPKLSSTLENIKSLRDKMNGITKPDGNMMPEADEDTPTEWPPKKEVNLY